MERSNVPLEEALAIAGTGRFTYFVVLTTGLIGTCGSLTVQAMSVVMPIAGCDLQLSDTNRGIITSMPYTGMVFSSQIFGYLADSSGRRKVMMHCQLAMLLVILFWSLTPGIILLCLILFANGFFLTGILTPVYVFVGEFSELRFRITSLIIMTGLQAVATIYLSSTAWVILPLDVHIPIFDFIVFNSWRLFILLLAIPYLFSIALLLKIPETPKFLLSQGMETETLEVLKKMYSIHKKKPKEDFPVLSLSLDLGDEFSPVEDREGNRFINYMQMMTKQIIILFSKKYAFYTVISCLLLFGICGTCNVSMIWFPDWTSRIRNYSISNKRFNVTFCSLMGKQNTDNIPNCQLDYDFLLASILLGISELASTLGICLISHKLNKKMYLVTSSFLSAALYLLTMFIKEEYTLIISIVVIINLLFIAFPMIINIILELFPTHLRSTAASITLTSCRIGSALGNQMMGILYDNHCTIAFYGFTFVLFVSGILCILIPTHNKSGQKI